MSIKSIKLWQVILAFIIWLGTMFLPATVNQEKLGTSFDYRESRENFFYFISHQFPFTVLFWLYYYCYRLSCFIEKQGLASTLLFASLIYYIGFLVVGFPGSIILIAVYRAILLKEKRRFLTFMGWAILFP